MAIKNKLNTIKHKTKNKKQKNIRQKKKMLNYF